jgi:hypothetical protein
LGINRLTCFGPKEDPDVNTTPTRPRQTDPLAAVPAPGEITCRLKEIGRERIRLRTLLRLALKLRDERDDAERRRQAGPLAAAAS